MAGPIAISIVGDERDLMRSLGRSEAGMSKLGKSAGRMGTAVKVGALAGAAAILKLGIDSVKAASDSQQSIGATETIFKRYAGTVIRESERAADKYGLSANSYRESANLIASLFKNQGIALDQLAGKTDQMVGVAADLSATFGGTTKEAVEALSSAFKGEFDPLEKYGISLKQSTISAALAAKGQDKLTGSALALAKQTATTKLILDQSSDAQGSFARESDTLAGAQQWLSANVENLEARLGTLLLPALTSLTSYANQNVLPMLEDFAGWLEDNQDEIGDFAGSVKNTLLPPLKTTVDVVGDIVTFFANLPDPVRNAGIEVGIAAIAFVKLRSAVGSIGLGAFIGQVRDAEARTAALGRAARTTAGIGGLALLMQSSRESSRSLGTLEGAAGGAMLGFSVAGAPGAVIGGLAGGLWGLTRSTDASSDAFRRAAPPVANYTEYINAATGAVSRLGKEQIVNDLRQRGAITDANRLGISTLTLVRAVEGHRDAQLAVNKTLAASQNFQGRFRHQTEESYEASRDLENQLGILAVTMSKNRREALENAVALGKFKRVLPGIPKEILTNLALKGADGAERRITHIAKLYDITDRRKIRALIELSGAEPTNKRIRGVLESLGLVSKAKADMKPWQRKVNDGITQTEREARRDVAELATFLGVDVGKGKADLRPFRASLLSSLDALRTSARSGGDSIGSAIGQGAVSGIAPYISAVANSAARMAKAAIDAARHEAAIASPSRKTIEIGRLLGEGLVVGITGSTPASERAIREHMRRTLLAAQAPAITPRQFAGTTFTRTRLVDDAGFRARQTIQVVLTAEQLHQLERGRRIALDLKAYRDSGGPV